MPRNVRNSWVTVNVDGRNSEMASGPVAKDGGLQAQFKFRHEGSIIDGITVTQGVTSDGKIHVMVEFSDELMTLLRVSDPSGKAFAFKLER